MFETAFKATISALITMFLMIPFALLGGWALMIGIGAVHGWIPAVPTAGYWTSVVIAYVWATVK